MLDDDEDMLLGDESQVLPVSEQRARFLEFLEWFEACGGWLSDYVEFKFSLSRGVHLCVKTTSPSHSIPSKTTVLSCPHELTLSALNAWDVPPLYPNRNPKEFHTKRLDLPENLLEGARPQAAAALWLVAQRKLGDKSWWAPYINTLPGVAPNSGMHTGAGILGMGYVNTPIWWDLLERQWIAGTNLEKGLVDLESIWEKDWTLWEKEIKAWSDKNGWEVTQTEFYWALTMLGSRAFPSRLVADSSAGKSGLPLLDEHDPDMLLYPGMDMLNHDPETKNRWSHDSDNFDLVCNDEPVAGQEIYNPYGAKSNASFLLSYGFVIENNPHDSIAVKLARKNQSLPAPRRRSFVKPDEVPEDPSMVPQGTDLNRGLFFVRPVSRHIVKDPDYPSETGLNKHLLGFPYVLLNILAGDLEVPRERRARAERPCHIRDLLLEEPSRDSHIDVYAELGQRNILAVTNLLLSLLRVQLTRLSNAELTNEGLLFPPKDSTSIKYSRWCLVRTYRASQRMILEENIGLLSARLNAALTTQQELMPLGTAMAYLNQVMIPSEWQEFLAGLQAGLGLESGSAEDIWAAEMEEPAWAIFLGVTMQLGHDQLRKLHSFMKPADSGGYWFDLLAVRYHDDEEDQPLDVENAAGVRGILDAVQATLGATGFWAQANWDDTKVRKLAKIVGRETLRITLAGYDAGVAGMQGHEDDDGAEPIVVTAMFVQ
ncbi:hypothetical protein FH972_021199 [Carpinus fangiana]|uniref:SET domain-containing protein n=1 Tax=Carpinus fangiana TaxID=176857 RepID=A0A5N6KNQ3_9ROSI|nr:hypothetical protein FH972_021199 [Carpinus fangiana]